jgi:polyphosphate glucokinase
MRGSIGVDVGGSSIKYALVAAEHGKLEGALQSVATPQPATASRLVESILTITDAMPTASVGVALPSVIQGGIVRTAANLDQSLIGLNIEESLRQVLRRSVVCLNDADAAGLAEVRWGAAQGFSGTVMVLTFGTGIGSAMFVDGRLYPNTELGHLELKGMEAEHWASARVRSAEALDWPQWAARVNDYLDRINNLFWPDLIVMGGAVSEQFREFGSLLRSRARILPAMLGAAAGVAGAALAAREEAL